MCSRGRDIEADRAFDVLLVDDTSRLSRHQATAMQLFERFNFAGVRVVAVGQGIDSSNDQADVLMAVHGLIDSQYVKELAKKTHRVLRGRSCVVFMLAGAALVTGAFRDAEGVRLEVDDAEAATVLRIFEMSAGGFSLKSIAKTLNGSGCHRLALERASGTQHGARVRFERCCGGSFTSAGSYGIGPGSSRSPEAENASAESARKTNGALKDRPERRIIGDELWGAVQDRLVWTGETYGRREHGKALLGRESTICSLALSSAENAGTT